MAHPKHQAVRSRYQYRCGYCGVSETDTGGELTVDHYYPVSAGGDDSDDLYKSDVIAQTSISGQELRILHPLRDDIQTHIRLNERTGKLESLTERGRFHITILRLNRAELIAYRQYKRMVQL